MIKIVKTASAQWLGNGFGNSTAEWGIVEKPETRIMRTGGLWVAVGGGVRRVSAETRKELEVAVSHQLSA